MREDLLLSLSHLYETPTKARAVAFDIVRMELVTTEGPATVVWASLLTEAHRNGCLDNLIERVSTQYPDQKPSLLRALENYRADRYARDVDQNKAVVVEPLEPSPFHVTGGMTPETRTYVVRPCDGELKSIATAHPFIWIQGDFQFGKTSLLNRHSLWLGPGWTVVYVDIQLCDRSTDARFRRDFFAEVSEALGQPQDWRSLKAYLRHKRIAFLLDELGACKDAQVIEMLERFHSLFDRASGHLKVIVTVREGPAQFMASCGVRNPKHKAAWKVVQLTALSRDQVCQLVDLFPNSISVLLRNRLDRIQAITYFHPWPVQNLLNRLWEEFGGSLHGEELTQDLVDGFLDSTGQ